MNRKATLLKILKYAKQYKLLVAGLTIFSFLNVLSSLIIPFVIGKGIDLMVSQGNVTFTGLITVLNTLIVLILINGISKFVSETFSSLLNYRISYDIRLDIFKLINYSHLKDLEKMDRGNLLSNLVNDIEQIGNGFTQNFQILLGGILTIIGTIIFMLTLNLTISLIVIVLTPVSLFLALILGKKSYALHFKQSELKGSITNKIEELVIYHNEVKSYNQAKKTEDDLDIINEELYKYGLKAQFMQALGNPGTRFINSVIYSVIVVLGGLFVVNDIFSVGTLIVFLTFASQYAKPFNEFTTVISDIQSALSSGERVFKVLQGEILEKDDDKPNLLSCEGNFQLDNASFSYDKSKKLLQNISLKVKKGNLVAIAGKTGAGKTTLINILMKFYDVDSGNIYIDGKDIYLLNTHSLREKIGMVLQDTWIFTGTVRDNIAYGKNDADFDQIKRAASLAHCEGFIKKLKHGYDTIIGEGGEKLSKGEEQLIAIARVMLIDPCILILDEATSDIDTRTEVKIQEGFRQLMNNKTTFIVAHRLSTIKNADLILVIKDGNIVEQGSHRELVSRKGEYFNLYKSS